MKSCYLTINGLIVITICIFLAIHVNADDLQSLQVSSDGLLVVHTLPGAKRAIRDEDMQILYETGLDEDIKLWQRAQLLRFSDLLDLLEQIDKKWLPYRRNFIAIVLVRENRFYYWTYPTARSWCTKRVKFIIQEFEKAVQGRKMVFPHTMFVLNAYDKPLCPTKTCAAPIFSFTKRVNSSGPAEDDILLPVLNHPFNQLVYYPWEKKNRRAFMRAGIYEAMSPLCSRVQLYHLSKKREAAPFLDFGITTSRHWKVRLPTVPQVPMFEHAKWRYLVSADGQAASWRLAKLLSMNSVVLKHRSSSIEHYYRALKQWVHYVPMNVSTLIPTLKAIKGQDSRMKEIARNAQHFAFTYLSQISRVAYARRAIQEYTSLFLDMDTFLQHLPSTNFTLSDLLELRAHT